MWSGFERILNFRSLICQFSLGLTQIFWYAQGNSRADNSLQYVSGLESTVQTERVLDALPYIDWAMILLSLVWRLILPFVFYWKPEVCKAIFGL